MSTLLITVVPSLIILSFFTFSDKFKEPKKTILLMFFLGFLICLPAGILNSFMYDQFHTGSDLSEKLYSSFLAPAWTEEILKFLILYTVVLRRHELMNQWMELCMVLPSHWVLLLMKIMIMYLD